MAILFGEFCKMQLYAKTVLTTLAEMVRKRKTDGVDVTESQKSTFPMDATEVPTTSHPKYLTLISWNIEMPRKTKRAKSTKCIEEINENRIAIKNIPRTHESHIVTPQEAGSRLQ